MSSPGAMDESTWASTAMTKSMATEPSRGLMVAATRASGTKVSSTEKASTLRKAKSVTAFGKWARESSGSRMTGPLNNDSYCANAV